MFCVTMWVQFVLYLPLLPTQTLDALGGLQLSDIPAIMWDGVRCTFGVTSTEPSGLPAPGLPHCDGANTAMFFAYTTVDFSCYFCGLYIIRRHGASLMVVASAVALPLQQIVFCLPFLAQYQERLYRTDGAALASVLLGFVMYYWAVLGLALPCGSARGGACGGRGRKELQPE